MFSTLTKRMPCTDRFIKWILPRGLLAILAICVCVFIIGNSRRIETGIVEYKLITGKSDGDVHVLMVCTGRNNLLIAPGMQDIVSAGYDHALIDHGLEVELRDHYTDIKYNVVMKLAGQDLMKSYVVPKDVFNNTETNSRMKLEIEKPGSNMVTKIVRDQHRSVNEIYCPPVNRTSQFMYQ